MSLKIGKWIGWFFIVFFGLFFVIILCLVINNRAINAKYEKVDTSLDYLTEKEIEDVEKIYEWIRTEGAGFSKKFANADTELLLYNKTYDFLFSKRKLSGEWTLVSEIASLNCHLYRRIQKEQKAFAVLVENVYVGSFATHDYYNQSILTQIPVIIPPQFVTSDDIYYRATVIHEMGHAFQGNLSMNRLQTYENEHKISERFETVSEYKEGIAEESRYLVLALDAQTREEKLSYLERFLSARDRRRYDCGYTEKETETEAQYEWMEGFGRYLEYAASRTSTSVVAKGLGKIEEKTKIMGDDKYYSLGMAEYRLVNELFEGWETDLFENGFTPESYLRNRLAPEQQ